jgi:hypothetical protein
MPTWLTTPFKSFLYACGIYLGTLLASVVLLGVVLIHYGALMALVIADSTWRAVLFLFLPLFVLLPPNIFFWRYCLAVPVIAGIGMLSVDSSGYQPSSATFYRQSSFIFLLCLSLVACLVNRRRIPVAQNQKRPKLDTLSMRAYKFAVVLIVGLLAAWAVAWFGLRLTNNLNAILFFFVLLPPMVLILGIATILMRSRGLFFQFPASAAFAAVITFGPAILTSVPGGSINFPLILFAAALIAAVSMIFATRNLFAAKLSPSSGKDLLPLNNSP